MRKNRIAIAVLMTTLLQAGFCDFQPIASVKPLFGYIVLAAGQETGNVSAGENTVTIDTEYGIADGTIVELACGENITYAVVAEGKIEFYAPNDGNYTITATSDTVASKQMSGSSNNYADFTAAKYSGDGKTVPMQILADINDGGFGLSWKSVNQIIGYDMSGTTYDGVSQIKVCFEDRNITTGRIETAISIDGFNSNRTIIEEAFKGPFNLYYSIQNNTDSLNTYLTANSLYTENAESTSEMNEKADAVIADGGKLLMFSRQNPFFGPIEYKIDATLYGYSAGDIIDIDYMGCGVGGSIHGTGTISYSESDFTKYYDGTAGADLYKVDEDGYITADFWCGGLYSIEKKDIDKCNVVVGANSIALSEFLNINNGTVVSLTLNDSVIYAVASENKIDFNADVAGIYTIGATEKSVASSELKGSSTAYATMVANKYNGTGTEADPYIILADINDGKFGVTWKSINQMVGYNANGTSYTGNKIALTLEDRNIETGRLETAITINGFDTNRIKVEEQYKSPIDFYYTIADSADTTNTYIASNGLYSSDTERSSDLVLKAESVIDAGGKLLMFNRQSVFFGPTKYKIDMTQYGYSAGDILDVDYMGCGIGGGLHGGGTLSDGEFDFTKYYDGTDGDDTYTVDGNGYISVDFWCGGMYSIMKTNNNVNQIVISVPAQMDNQWIHEVGVTVSDGKTAKDIILFSYIVDDKGTADDSDDTYDFIINLKNASQSTLSVTYEGWYKSNDEPSDNYEESTLVKTMTGDSGTIIFTE